MLKIACNKAAALSAAAEPVAEVQPGVPFVVETLNAYGDCFRDLAEFLALLRNKTNRHHPLTGPLHVRGALAGDVLRVEVRSVTPHEMAQSLSKSAGAEPLKDPLFGDRAPVIGTVRRQGRDRIAGIDYGPLLLPYEPMVGILGTAPAEGQIRAGHGGPTGGNLDLPFVRPGSTVYLPVERDGGWLYAGDAHALQAYGELGGIALECSAEVELCVTRRRPGAGWFEQDPYVDTTPSLPPVVIAGVEPLSGSKGIGIVGIAPELGRLDRAVVVAYRAAVKFVKLVCPRASWGEARNLITLLGHSLNGQAAALTAESTCMIFFKEADLVRLFRVTGDALDEITRVLFPEAP
jgi:acetamidase/formamidase